MDEDPGEAAAPRRLFADLSPLRESPAFARLWIGNSVSGIGSQLTIVAIGLQIYALTSSTFAVSLVALFAIGPMIVFGLYGGTLADSFDRRKVALVAAVLAWGSTVTIAALAWLHVELVWPLYLLATLNAVAATVIGTTRNAIYPRILPRRLLPAASALNGIGMGVSITLGPALGGLLVATVGFGWAYTLDAVLFVTAFLGIATLPAIVPETGGRRSAGLRAILDGFRFLARAGNVRTSFLVDLTAMTFGQPRTLFPAVGALLIGGGAMTVGILTAAYAVGGLASSVFSGRLGHVRRQGRAICAAVLAYGAFILAFALVLLVLALGRFGPVGLDIARAHLPALALAALALAGAGGADNISAIFRMTLMQAAVPDAMQGRTQGVFSVVVAGGPRVGDLYVGVLSTVAALWFPPLLGGVAIMVIVGVLLRVQRGFREYDALNPVP